MGGVFEGKRMKTKCDKKSIVWLMVIVVIVCVVTICMLFKTVGGKDYLTVCDSVIFLKDIGTIIQKKEEGEICNTEFEVSLGDKVKSGILYVEEWYNGVCEQSVPILMTQDLAEIFLHITAELDYSEVVISTNELGGEWTIRYDIPHDETVADWAFTSRVEGEVISVQAGEESILGALQYDNGRKILVRVVWSQEPAEKLLEENAELNQFLQDVRPPAAG